MTQTIDAILAIIDTGLQTAGDTAYGDDHPGTCWRCREPADDLCPRCRDELLAEVVVPPIRRSPYEWVVWANRHHQGDVVWLTTTERNELMRTFGRYWLPHPDDRFMGRRICILDQPPATP